MISLLTRKQNKAENIDVFSKFFKHTSSREQKKIMMKAIDRSIKKQREVLRDAGMLTK